MTAAPASAPASPPAAGSVRALNALARADMFVFGIVMALVGAVVPALTGRMPLTLAMIGNLFLFMNFSMLMASLVVGLVMDRYGHRLPLALGAWLVGLALALIAGAASYGPLLASVVCLGFGGGALNATANTLVADLHEDPERKAAALNLLGVFFGFGALVLPFSIGALMQQLGVSTLLFTGSALCIVIGIAATLLPFPPPKQRHGWPLANMSRFIRIPVVAATAFLLFFQSGNEFLLGGYIGTFFTRELGASVGAASYVLAAYWASIMIARAVLSRALPRVGAASVVLAGAMVAAAGALLTAVAGTQALAVAGALVTGLALAGVFPSALGLIGGRFQEHSGTVFGILFTVALCGGMTVPWVAGHLAESAGMRAVFVLAAANFLAVALLSALANRRGEAGGVRRVE